MHDQALSWFQVAIQLIGVILTVIGGLWAVFRFLRAEFGKMSDKIVQVENRISARIDSEIARINNRIDILFARGEKYERPKDSSEG